MDKLVEGNSIFIQLTPVNWNMHGKDSSRLDYEQYLLVGEVRRASKYNRKKFKLMLVPNSGSEV